MPRRRLRDEQRRQRQGAADDTPFTSVYIQPAAGDNGTALGAAYYVWNETLGQNAVRDGARVLGHVARRGARAGSVPVATTRGSTMSSVSDERGRGARRRGAHRDGQVVGWYQGRMEWGARALGNRSILADPRRQRRA